MNELCRSVAEDVQYLAAEWNQDVTTAALRRGSSVLRRLLVNDDFLRAWKAAGILGRPTIEAPRGEVFLEIPGHSTVEIIITGASASTTRLYQAP